MIAHVDADSFFASVLVRKYPHWRGKPLLALGMGGGCVIAASYEAKAKGVRTGMRVVDALKLCPEAAQMASDFTETALASQEIQAILAGHCPVMEEASIDEWFLDLRSLVGGVPFDLLLWGKDIQREIVRMTALSVSVGIAPSKLLAKMASEYKKPKGVSVVEKRDIETFLSDRPAAAIPGIGRQRVKHADAHRWATAWDFAIADQEKVRKLFGKNGPELQRELLGERLFEVRTDDSPPKSISRCRSFRGTRDKDAVWAHVLQHVSYCVLKMRKQHLAARGISLWLRDGTYDPACPAGRHAGVQQRLPQAMDTEEAITPIVKKCFNQLYRNNIAYTQVGFGLGDLHDRAAVQFSLFRDPNDKLKENLVQASLDSLRIQFGRDVVVRGSALSTAKRRKGHLNLPMFQ